MYVPEQGDIIWLDFDPTKGFEQSGRRPALVLTPIAYNTKTGLCIVCPITSKVKGYPFEFPVPVDCEVKGVVLLDHMKNQDWQVRHAEKIVSIPQADLRYIQEVLKNFLFT
jgi:mRNA interferase MazF